MANDEQVQILKKSVQNWNDWREDHPETPVEMDGANLEAESLTNANLRGACLREANLRGANLYGADLSNADLTSADLRRIFLTNNEANLRRANLHHAKLNHANLSNASLREADLSHARLYQTDLISADLFGANLSHAHWRSSFLGETVLTNVDLSTVAELASCQHFAPSFVDFRTLKRSGPLPLPFLRGCGLPDRLIANLPSLLDEVAKFYSCFISYSTQDEAFANQLHTDLQNKGVRCWFAAENQKIGDDFRQRIDDAIRLHQKLLLILSRRSLRSGWVQREVGLCLELEQKEDRQILVPVRLDDEVMEAKLPWAASTRTRHIGDFRDWRKPYKYKTGLERLLRDLTIDADSAGAAG